MGNIQPNDRPIKGGASTVHSHLPADHPGRELAEKAWHRGFHWGTALEPSDVRGTIAEVLATLAGTWDEANPRHLGVIVEEWRQAGVDEFSIETCVAAARRGVVDGLDFREEWRGRP